MNDFTKEDLKFISIALERFSVKDKELTEKIQSMIDNHCEHKKDVWPLYTMTGDLPCSGLCFCCGQCVGKEFINE